MFKDLFQLTRFLKHLLNYRYGEDYVIKCVDHRACLEIFSNNLFSKLRNVFTNIDNETCIEILLSNDTCLTTRVISVDEDISIDEYRLLILLSKTISCGNPLKTLIFIDDSTQEYDFMNSIYKEYARVYGNVSNILEFIQYVKIIRRYKDIYDEIKTLEKQLKYQYIETLREQYSEKLRELDHILPKINEIWLKNRELFEQLHRLVFETDFSKQSEENINNTNTLREMLRKQLLDISREYQHGIEIIYTSGLGGGRDILGIISSIYRYLRSMGCNKIYLLDGEKYIVYGKLLNLDIDVIVI